MKIDVIPTKKVNDIEFGMCREQVRAILGEATEFFKFDDDENTTDDFGYCHIFYDKNNKCEAVEIFDDAEVYLNNVRIFPTDLETARKIITDFESDDDGLTCYSKSIGIYAPDGEMESILFGREGYYDEDEE